MSAQRAAQLVEAGLWLRLSGDLEGARRLFEQALRLEPTNARARQLLDAAPAPGPAPAAPGPDPFQRPVAPPVSPVSDMDWGLETGMAPEASPPVPSPELSPEYQQPGGGAGSSTLVFGITAPPPPPPPVAPAAPPPPVQSAAQPWGQVPFETEELTWDESAVPTTPAVPVVPAPAAVSGSTMMFSGGLPPVPAPAAPSGGTMMFSGGAAPVIPPLVPAPAAPAAGGGTMLFSSSPVPAIPSVAPVVPPPPAAGGGTMLFSSGPPAPPVEELADEELELSVDEPLAAPPPPPPAAGGGTMLFSGGAELVPALGVPAPPPDEATTEALDLDVTFDEPMPRPPPSSPALAADATSAWDKRSNPGITITKTDPGMGKALDLVDPPPVPSAPTARRENELEVLLRGARDLLELDDHSGAMELILKAQAVSPDHPEVKALKERSERTLQTMYESKLGPLNGTPRVRLKDDEIIWLNLDHRAGFVLAQIDGSMTFEDVFAVSGMSRLDTARILAQLLEEGVIVR